MNSVSCARLLKVSILLAAAATGAACNLAPRYERPQALIRDTWPAALAARTVGTGETEWRRIYQDPRLQRLIQLALENNQELKQAAARVVAARANYAATRARAWGTIDAGLTGTLGRYPADDPSVDDPANRSAGSRQDYYKATVGLSAFEIDVFGRLRSQTQSARHSALSEDELRGMVQSTLVAQVAEAFTRLCVDADILNARRQDNLDSQEASALADARLQRGEMSASDADLIQIASLEARARLANSEKVLIQDKAWLELLLGAPLPTDLSFEGAPTDVMIAAPGVGTPSDVIARRPDILAAEHQLRAANADIGAARAAFFPRISLVGEHGVASTELSSLFKDGGRTWTLSPAVVLPLFSGGRALADLRGAEAGKASMLAQYQLTIQGSFREVVDELANEQAALEGRDAALLAFEAAKRRYGHAKTARAIGYESQVDLLAAKREFRAASLRLAEARFDVAVSRVRLARAMGSGATS